MRRLDRIDREILVALQKNARLPNKELAERAGVAPSTCLERVRRLLRDGVLRGFRAEIDPRALGIGLEAMMAVRLVRHSRDLVFRFRDEVRRLPEVVELYHMSGKDDFLVHVVVRDIEHLREFGMSALTTRPEVAHLETSVVFEHVAKHELPVYIEVEEG